MNNRRDAFDYPRALKHQLPIGSGLIESGQRHVLQARLKAMDDELLARQVNPEPGRTPPSAAARDRIGGVLRASAVSDEAFEMGALSFGGTAQLSLGLVRTRIG